MTKDVVDEIAWVGQLIDSLLQTVFYSSSDQSWTPEMSDWVWSEEEVEREKLETTMSLSEEEELQEAEGDTMYFECMRDETQREDVVRLLSKKVLRVVHPREYARYVLKWAEYQEEMKKWKGLQRHLLRVKDNPRLLMRQRTVKKWALVSPRKPDPPSVSDYAERERIRKHEEKRKSRPATGLGAATEAWKKEWKARYAEMCLMEKADDQCPCRRARSLEIIRIEECNLMKKYDSAPFEITRHGYTHKIYLN